jgi:hypothetical protein
VCSDQSEGAPPVSIPTTVVKPLCADGTALVTAWESRTSLDHKSKTAQVHYIPVPLLLAALLEKYSLLSPH